MNTFISLVYGFVIEDHFGKRNFFLNFFVVGFIGNSLSSYFYTSNVYTGAANGVFALLGMNSFYFYKVYNYMGNERKNNSLNFAWIVGALYILFLLNGQDAWPCIVSFALGVYFTFSFQ